MVQLLHLRIDEPFSTEFRGGAVSVGNFDGVHRGHVALVREVRRQARELPGPATIVTFDPHPLRLLAPDRFMPQLTDVADRCRLLKEAGADVVVVLQTTQELLSMEAAAFLQRLMVEQLGAKAIVEGFNFRFGRSRLGTTDFLTRWCGDRGIHCTIVPAELAADGQPYSSSRVRRALDEGDLLAVRQLLGRDYSITGTVGAGENRGRSLGFPTANLTEIPVHIPADGVYAAWARVGSNNWPAAVNIGPNPTFGENHRKVEVHVIGFDGNLYGTKMQVEFVHRLRAIRRFASKEELISQLQSDVASVRKTLLLGSSAPPIECGSAATDLKSRVQHFLNTAIAPAFAIEAASFEVVAVADGVLQLRFLGQCASCPSSIMTLILGIEQELRKQFPEIEYLEAVP